MISYVSIRLQMYRINYITKIFVGIVITFLCLHSIHNGSLSPDSKRNESKDAYGLGSGKEIPSGRNSGVGSAVVEHGPIGTPSFVNLPTLSALSDEEINSIAAQIAYLNNEQEILNEDKFGPIDEGTYVLVIQVHSRVEYLGLLIESLSRVQTIDHALVIFSHDIFIPELNEAIRKIDFTRVLQIFYPYSLQLHPHTFPGESPDDCPRNVLPKKAKQDGCRNANYPDVHGHYREARYTQTKHHWWWKANFVFNGIRSLKNHSGMITFLEEDHYVTPDFLWVMNLMETEIINNRCMGCHLLSMGTYLKSWNMRTSHAKGVVTTWISSLHNMGMVFNRTLFHAMTECAKSFCTYDDYNWDWSLLEVSNNCLNSSLKVFYPKAPRVFHIGDCGVHHKKKTCDPTTAARIIDNGVKQFQSLLFPDKLLVEAKAGKKMKLKKGNGGWGDWRDHQLCLSFPAKYPPP